MAEFSPCPPVPDLRKLVLGQMSVDHARALTRHLALCPLCQETLQRSDFVNTLADSQLGRSPRQLVHGILQHLPESNQRNDAASIESLLINWDEARAKGQDPRPEDLCRDCPHLVDELKSRIQAIASLHAFLGTLSGGEGPDSGPTMGLSSPQADSQDYLSPPKGPDELGWLGPYRIRKVLGAGGMGRVYLADDPRLKRQVAVKVMAPGLAANPQARERFLREAQAAAAVEHDHVIPIFEVDEENGVPYLVMPLLKGETLEDRLKRDNRLGVGEAVRIARQIAEGLAAAHEMGLIHRDIKPGNVWLETRQRDRETEGRRDRETASHATPSVSPSLRPAVSPSRVKILDFGLARGDKDELHLTQTGQLLGTPAFMAPEQGTGDPVDQRCDLFSLGGVLYRMLTGELAFKGKSLMAFLQALNSQQPVPPHELNPEVPPPLSSYVLKLLAKDPAQRPASSAQVVHDLADLEAQAVARPESSKGVGTVEDEHARPSKTQGVPPSDSPVVAPPAVARSPDRATPARRALVAVGLLALAGIIIAGIVVIIRDRDGNEVARIKVPDKGSVTIEHDKKKPDDIPRKQPPVKAGPSPFDALDPAKIPAAERFPWQPKELVAVIGSHARRMWGHVTGVAISPDGKSAATSSGYETVIWNVETQTPKWTIPTTTDTRFPMQFSPDSKRLLMPQLRSLEIWDLSGEKPVLSSFGEQEKSPTWMDRWGELIEDGATLVKTSPGEPGKTSLFDITGNKPLEKTKDFMMRGRVIATAANQIIYVAAAGKVRRATIRKATIDKDEELPIKLGEQDDLRAVRPDGKRLAVWRSDRVQLWDLSQTPPKSLPDAKELTSAFVNPHSYVSFSPDGRWLTTQYNSVTLYRIDGPEPKFVADLDPTSTGSSFVAFSRDGNKIVIGNYQGFVRFWDLSGPEPRELSPFDPATAFGGDPYGCNVALDSRTGQIMLRRYDRDGFRRFQLWNLNGATPQAAGDEKTFLDDQDWGRALANGRWLALLHGRPYGVYAQERNGWKPVGKGIGESCSRGVLSEDRTLLVTFAAPKPELWPQPDRIEAWDVEATPPALRWSMSTRDHPVYSPNLPLLLSADKRWFAYLSQKPKDGPASIAIWRNTGPKPEIYATIPFKNQPMHFAAAIAPDGRYLCHLKDVVQGECIVVEDLSGPEPREVRRFSNGLQLFGFMNRGWLAFHPDGKKLVACGDGGVSVLEVPSGKVLWKWEAPGAVHWAEFAPDGRHLFLHNGNKTIYVLRLPQFAVKTDGKTIAKIGPDDKKESDKKPDPKPPDLTPKQDPIDFAAERKAAEWLFELQKKHGKDKVVFSFVDAKGSQLGSNSLPEVPFAITSINAVGIALEDTGLANLAGCRRLEHLQISANIAITDAGIQHLSAVRSLQSVYLAGTGLGDAGMEVLASLRNLEFLLIHNTKVTDRGLAKFRSDSPLRTLTLGGSITEVGLAALAENCQELRDLHLFSDPSSIKNLRWLPKLPRLRMLLLTAEFLKDDANVAVLASLPALEHLQLLSPINASPPARLKSLAPKLRAVSYNTSSDDDPGISELAWKGLPDLRELEYFGIFGNKQQSINGPALLLFADLPRLRLLDLHLTEPANRKYTTADIAAFRQKRPDVEFRDFDGKTTVNYPALDSWPGKDEGQGILPWPKEGPAPAVLPFTPEQAKKFQETWAAHLKLDVETKNSIGMKLRLIPPGDVLVQEGEKKILARLKDPYYLGATEVTRGQFAKFVEATGHVTQAEASEQPQTWRKPGFDATPDHPITYISINDARAFCDWLSKKEAAIYRLPTDWEWDHAARGGGAGENGWCTTPEMVREAAWTGSSCGPVARRAANPFLLFDVISNVYEYCEGNIQGQKSLIRTEAFGARGGNYTTLALNSRVPGDFPQNPDVGFRILRQTTKTPLPGNSPVLVRKGQPLSPQAIVSRPPPLKGLRSWSVELGGQSHRTLAIAWSPRGDLIATGSIDGVRLWDRDGNLKSLLIGHEGSVYGVAFSPDGKLLASCEISQTPTTVRLWDVATGQSKVLITTASVWFWQVRFAPSGKQLAAAFNGGCYIFDLESGESRWHSNIPDCLQISWSPDGQFLFATDGRGTSAVWDLAGKRVGDVIAPDGPEGKPANLSCLDWSPDGKHLAATCDDAKVRIWDAATRKHVRTIPIKGTGSTTALAWNKDSRRVAVAGGGGLLEILDAHSGKSLTTTTDGVGGNGLAWSPNGQELAAPSYAPSFFDATTGKMLRAGPIRGASGAPHSIILSSAENCVYYQINSALAFDLVSGSRVDLPEGPARRLQAVADDGSWRLYTNSEKEAWLTRPGARTVELTLPGNAWTVQPNATATLLASTFEKQTLVWNGKTGGKSATLDHPATVGSIAWATDGKRLATVAADKQVRLWDASTGKLLNSYRDFPEVPKIYPGITFPQTLAWDDNRRLWAALNISAVSIDTQTGKITPAENFSNGNQITHLAVSPKADRLLASEGYGWTYLRESDLEGGTRRRLLGQWLGRAPVWHPDGRRFLGADYFGIRGFDTRTGRRLGTLWPVVGGEHWLCVGPDGHYRGSKGVEAHIVYVALHEDGRQVTYTPAEFEKQFGWKNDPAKARLLKLDP